MPRDPNRPAGLTGQVFRGAEAIRRGTLTADELRSAAWLHLRHDVYADSRLERDHALACRAALIRLPPTTVLAGPSAAYLHGAIHAAGFHDDIHVITPPVVRVGAQRGLRVHHLDLPPTETTRRAGLPVTGATRTAWDLAAWLDPVMAVPVIDTLLALDLTTSAALTDQLARHANQRGWRRAQRAFTLADAGAQSPPESRLRVRLVLAGLPKPIAQCPVRVSPTLILHPDLAWEEWRVAVEYDGEWHADPDQLHRDRRRLNQLVTAGWTVLHVTGKRLHQDFPGIVREVKTALTSKGWHPRRPSS
ncbi:MAG: DUF559 domain-containing protein [Actinoplanes sp.]